MARPNPEEKWNTYIEQFTTNIGYNQYSRNGRNFYRSYTSTNTPGFPRVKRWNAQSVYKVSVPRTSSLTLYEYWQGRPDLGWGDYKFGIHSAGITTTLWDDVELDSNLLARTKSAHQDEIANRRINLAQMFAERRQTVNLITNTARRIARSLTHVRRGRIVEAARVLGLGNDPRIKPSGSVASDWLALQYGWKPLLSDVHGACETLANASYQKPLRIATLTKRSAGQLRILPATFFTGLYAVPGKFERFETSRCRLESVYEVSNELIRAGGQTGILDPLTLAWELVPYSFVVDWFIPVGNFLSRLRFDDGLTFVSALQTQLAIMNGQIIPNASTSIPSGGKVLVRNCSGNVISNAIRKERKIISSLSVDLPRFKDPFSPTHALNAIALLRVAGGR